MSIKLMSQVWEMVLSHPHQSILLALADHSNDDGANCYPGVPYLAWKTGYSQRQVQRILHEIEERCLIETVAIAGGHAPTCYNLHLERGDKKSPLQVKRGDKSSKTGVTNRTRGVTSTTGRGDISGSPYKEGTIVEPSEEPSEEPKNNMSSKPDPVFSVFAYYQEKTGKPRAKLDDKRRKLITARLKQYSVEELKLAIDGCKRSLWHQGANDRNQVYDSIELICRDAQHVDQFIEIATRNGTPLMSKTALHNQETLRQFRESEAQRNGT